MYLCRTDNRKEKINTFFGPTFSRKGTIFRIPTTRLNQTAQNILSPWLCDRLIYPEKCYVCVIKYEQVYIYVKPMLF